MKPRSPVRAVDPRYVVARRVLLDALTTLAPHGPAVIVADAQAVYLRAGDADLTIAPYTTDGDLAIDPTLLDDEPQLARAMGEAGFSLGIEPGIWLAPAVVDGEDVTIPVDLIVPEHAAPPGGRRGARLGPHGNRAVCVEAVRMLDTLFGRAGRVGVQMASRALRLAVPESEVETLCVVYTQELLRIVR